MKDREPGWGNIPWMQLWDAMKQCPQTEGQSVWEHGESVANHLSDLIEYLRGQKDLAGWRVPDWLAQYRSQLLASLPSDPDMLLTYAMYHDCGKPFCREVDAEGKQHFPDHARVSRDKYLEVAPDGSENRYEIADLIYRDMDVHLLKAEQVDAFCENKFATSLLLAGLSEIHSNAKMFGGIESVSFKIKFKQLDRRGKAICQKLFENKEKENTK